MNKRNIAISLIVILIILFISLTIFTILDLNNNPNIIKYMLSTGTSDKLAITKSYDNDFEIIKINSSGADINIKHIDSDEFIVNIYGDKKEVKVNGKDNKLNIDINKKNFINKDIYKIVIYVPFDYDKYVFIDNEYGDINISTFNNTNFEINLDYGNIYVDSSNRLDIKTELGDIYIGNSNYIDINSSISRIDIDEVNDIAIDNNIGNIIIKKVNNYIDINNNVGDIKIDKIDISDDSKIELNVGNIDINYLNKVDTHNIIGNITDNKKAQKGNYKFIVENKVGNIKIKHS